MTLDEFRNNPALVGRMAEVFSDPVVARALSLMKDANPPVEMSFDCPEVVSVRLHSQRCGWEDYHNKFLSLGTPFLQPIELGEPTFGAEEIMSPS